MHPTIAEYIPSVHGTFTRLDHNLSHKINIKQYERIETRCGLDLALLWLWCRPAAVALTLPLAWEFPYAVGVPPPKKIVSQKLDELDSIGKKKTIKPKPP